ncbi:tectonic-1 [Rhinoderma darwinii]|uniref:tectonic-1 n=1 Tax=Rhinoderma darwinii TaxID=43563 RepID=UPI003F661D0F
MRTLFLVRNSRKFYNVISWSQSTILDVYSNAKLAAAMSLCQRCIAVLFVAALCRVAASGTEEPDATGYSSADNVTELGELLGNDSLQGTGGASTIEPNTGAYTGSPASAVTAPSGPQSEAPVEFTTTKLPAVTVDHPLSTELPQLRSIPPLVTTVASLCVCDLLVNECDVNCCCDPDCGATDFSVFSGCSIPIVTSDSQLCQREAVLYSISSSKVPQRVTATVGVVNPNLFCIQATNYQPALSFITPDDPTEANFESLLKEFGGMDFKSESDVQSKVDSAEARNASKYEYGSPILTRDSYLKLPAPLGTSECTDSNPVGFLENQDFTCIRNIPIENCSIPLLTLGTYKNIEVLAVPTSQNTINVTLQGITIKSVDGAVFRGNLSDYTPSYDSITGVCNDVVLGGSYTFIYTDQGEITSIAASFILGAIDQNNIEQKFQIHFIENGTAPTPLSGNPGYVFGLPVGAGFKLPQSGIIQSTNRFGQFTLLKSSLEQNCLAEEGNRTPVLFGYNMMSGCRLRVNYTSDAFCKLVGAAVLNVLKGQQFPNYVAQFGNSQPENVLDWVPINMVVTTDQAEVQGMCKIPVSLKLEVRWTKFGSLVNPQAQIVNVAENIAYAFFPNNLEGARFVQISSSLTFFDVSQPANPGYKAQPTIDAKLPFDFFHPFL